MPASQNGLEILAKNVVDARPVTAENGTNIPRNPIDDRLYRIEAKLDQLRANLYERILAIECRVTVWESRN
jgi:hypothetical protein